MSDHKQARSALLTIADDLTLADLRAALAAGLGDFKSAPQFGLFFALIFVISGAALSYLLAERGDMEWLIPAAAGFPLIAPFIAVGLYEVSRRLEARLPLSWSAVLGALRGRGDEQILSMGVILFVAFGFWIMVAHGIVAVFLIENGAGSESIAVLLSPSGLLMLAIGSIIGGLMALAFYAITVVSLPMLVDQEVDFLTAIITSLQVFRANKGLLLIWAIGIAVTLFVAMVPLFLGLFIVLPVLGHATWHLYRRAVVWPPQ